MDQRAHRRWSRRGGAGRPHGSHRRTRGETRCPASCPSTCCPASCPSRKGAAQSRLRRVIFRILGQCWHVWLRLQVFSSRSEEAKPVFESRPARSPQHLGALSWTSPSFVGPAATRTVGVSRRWAQHIAAFYKVCKQIGDQLAWQWLGGVSNSMLLTYADIKMTIGNNTGACSSVRECYNKAFEQAPKVYILSAYKLGNSSSEIWGRRPTYGFQIFHRSNSWPIHCSFFEGSGWGVGTFRKPIVQYFKKVLCCVSLHRVVEFGSLKFCSSCAWTKEENWLTVVTVLTFLELHMGTFSAAETAMHLKSLGNTDNWELTIYRIANSYCAHSSLAYWCSVG